MRKNCQKYFFVPFIYFGIANNINKHKVLAKSRLHICTNFTLFSRWYIFPYEGKHEQTMPNQGARARVPRLADGSCRWEGGEQT